MFGGTVFLRQMMCPHSSHDVMIYEYKINEHSTPNAYFHVLTGTIRMYSMGIVHRYGSAWTALDYSHADDL
jgi:hypothetical protein